MGYWSVASLSSIFMYFVLNLSYLRLIWWGNATKKRFYFSESFCLYLFFLSASVASSWQNTTTERRDKFTITRRIPVPCCWLQTTASTDTWAAKKRALLWTTWSDFLMCYYTCIFQQNNFCHILFPVERVIVNKASRNFVVCIFRCVKMVYLYVWLFSFPIPDWANWSSWRYL